MSLAGLLGSLSGLGAVAGDVAAISATLQRILKVPANRIRCSVNAIGQKAVTAFTATPGTSGLAISLTFEGTDGAPHVVAGTLGYTEEGKTVVDEFTVDGEALTGERYTDGVRFTLQHGPTPILEFKGAGADGAAVDIRFDFDSY